MWPFVVKTLISALLIAGAAELGRRSTLAGALLASLPLTSLLAIIWLWRDTHDASRIATFTRDILWLVLPSLLFFVVLPLCLDRGIAFWPALAIALLVTIVAYAAVVFVRGGFA